MVVGSLTAQTLDRAGAEALTARLTGASTSSSITA